MPGARNAGAASSTRLPRTGAAELRTRLRLAREMPNGQRQGERAQPVGKNGSLAAVDLPAFPDGQSSGEQHHDASYTVQAMAFPPALTAKAPVLTILTAEGRVQLPGAGLTRVHANPYGEKVRQDAGKESACRAPLRL